jgi:hypothetical protein
MCLINHGQSGQEIAKTAITSLSRISNINEFADSIENGISPEDIQRLGAYLGYTRSESSQRLYELATILRRQRMVKATPLPNDEALEAFMEVPFYENA